jgi:two-component system, cell cycle response regulator DivK
MQESSRGRVLVVEDEEETRLAYRAILEQAGWTVDEAVSGDEAVERAALRPPALMLVDIAIPGLDGWETTRRVKSGPASPPIAVLAVTGHALDEDRQRAREAGCDGYLVKPVTADQLLAAVARLAGQGTEQDAEV